ncbi:hypothetical protein [Legionella feeleii]|uniref:Uncharacterized protein n=1 Tax=Legionella feeleii TaxID=453 RepID=A0A378J305_9GAMM|nr:hypothetical protein [Legionella feeleii]STX38674.1 Uncharacterised protein [Legionella feeleii]
MQAFAAIPKTVTSLDLSDNAFYKLKRSDLLTLQNAKATDTAAAKTLEYFCLGGSSL